MDEIGYIYQPLAVSSLSSSLPESESESSADTVIISLRLNPTNSLSIYQKWVKKSKIHQCTKGCMILATTATFSLKSSPRTSLSVKLMTICEEPIDSVKRTPYRCITPKERHFSKSISLNTIPISDWYLTNISTRTYDP